MLKYADLLSVGLLGRPLKKGEKPADVAELIKLLDSEGGAIDHMAPCLALKGAGELDAMNSTHVISLGPGRIRGRQDRMVNQPIIHGRNIIPIRQQPEFLKEDGVSGIKRFEGAAHLKGLLPGIREKGILAYHLPSIMAGKDLLKSMQDAMVSVFRHFTFIKLCKNMMIHPGMQDDIVPVMMFFDLKYFIPIFNPKKADGIGVRILYLSRDNTEKNVANPVFYSEMVASNNRTNLFYLDGVSILKENRATKDVIGSYRKIVSSLEEASKAPKKKASPEKSEKSKGGMAMYKAAKYTSSNYISVDTSSSTSTWYTNS
jgi:hypothetical protein